MINEPGTINYVLNLFKKFSDNGYLLETKQLEELLNHQIISHAPLGHGSEVAWSLWGSIIFGLKIYPDAVKLISKTDDPAVALLALDAESRGLMQDPLEKDSWSLCMNQEGLYGDQWLLSYEANIKKWIPIKDKDYVKDDPRFNHLKKNGVQFYDSINAAKRPTYDTLYTSRNYHNVSD